MTDFWKDMEQGAKCIRLVEQFLKEEENLLKRLTERGVATNASEFRIARMKYALGKTSKYPDYRKYFPIQNEVIL